MWDWLSKLEELRSEAKSVAVVTVANFSGSTPREIGAKMLVCEDGEFFGTIGGGNLERLAIADAVSALKDGNPRFTKFPLGPTVGQCCGGSVGLLVEVLGRGPKLYVFGAGHVGRAICQVLTGTPFQIHLVDARSEWLLSNEIPSAVVRHSEPWTTFLATAEWNAHQTYCVILTHQHSLDQAILAEIAERPSRYVGLIGSRTKWARFRMRLKSLGLSEQTLDRVTCPIGVPLKGKSPKEIAISFAAQILGINDDTTLDTARRRPLQPNGFPEGPHESARATTDRSPVPTL